MIVVDANLLVYALVTSYRQHEAAWEWLEAQLANAHLAALEMEHGLSVATSDGGFSRFERLTWFDPLRP